MLVLPVIQRFKSLETSTDRPAEVDSQYRLIPQNIEGYFREVLQLSWVVGVILLSSNWSSHACITFYLERFTPFETSTD
jgi:hypothetical protein